MKKAFVFRFLLVLALSATLTNCSKSKENIPDDIEIQDFIWKGMNAYYLWQGDVADLADSRFASQSQLNDFLLNYREPKELFQNLLYKPGEVDKFSWIVDDYVALENAFQGITLNNGMEYGLVRYQNKPSNIFGYVRYVVPSSNADTKGVTRGMIFNKVNGRQLNENNYRNLLNRNVYTIELAEYNGGNPTANGTKIRLEKAQLQENPIKIAKTFTEGTKKIGYLMYNQFAQSFDGQLNTAFGNFKADNVDELIIDLRYNGGGSVRTATYLGAMITGQFEGQTFSKQRWNQKVVDAVNPDRFINKFTNQINNGSITESINSLNLTSVYFIVSKSTASASELIINSLKPYINVKVVGKTTYGKHVGSITLYDSDDYTRNGANLSTSHTWAMQPIVLEILNKNNQSNPLGITPNIVLKEDFGNLGVLGEKTEPLLQRTLTYITTGAKSTNTSKTNFVELEEIGNSRENNPTYNTMYVDFK